MKLWEEGDEELIGRPWDELVLESAGGAPSTTSATASAPTPRAGAGAASTRWSSRIRWARPTRCCAACSTAACGPAAPRRRLARSPTTPTTPTRRSGRRAGAWSPTRARPSARAGRCSPASRATRPAPTTTTCRPTGSRAAPSRWPARAPGGAGARADPLFLRPSATSAPPGVFRSLSEGRNQSPRPRRRARLAGGTRDRGRGAARLLRNRPADAPDRRRRQPHAGGRDRHVRVPVVWSSVQPSPRSTFHWGALDEAVELTARAHLEVLPFLYGTPHWLGRPPPCRQTAARPRRSWSIFLQAAAERYGPQGEFWIEHGPASGLRPEDARSAPGRSGTSPTSSTSPGPPPRPAMAAC